MEFKVGDKLISKHSNGEFKAEVTEILNNGYVVKFENGSKDYFSFLQLKESYEIKKVPLKEKLQNYLDQNNLKDVEYFYNQACDDKEDRDIGYYGAKLEVLNQLKQMLENYN